MEEWKTANNFLFSWSILFKIRIVLNVILCIFWKVLLKISTNTIFLINHFINESLVENRVANEPLIHFYKSEIPFSSFSSNIARANLYSSMVWELRISSLKNSRSTRSPPFAINSRILLLQITIHILNSKTKQKYLQCHWVFILQVTFILQVSFQFYRITTL